jgi:hypothetical protein
MKDNRLGGWALVAGAVVSILVMLFHPGGAHHVSKAQFENLIALIIGVHALAMAGLPVSFAGALVLTRRLDSPGRIAVVGLIVYGFGLLAYMAAAAMSGLVTPGVLREMVAHTPASEQWHTLLDYSHSINQAFAQIGAVAFCVAIVLWSVAMLRGRVFPVGLAIYGLASSVVIFAALILGFLDLELHGFILITFAQVIWFGGAGISLIQKAEN